MDLDDLRALVRVAEAGSISGAARAGGLPKSSLSRSLSRLEGEVGAVLVERGTRALRLTEAGRLFLPHAHRIVEDVAEAKGALGGLAGAPTGTLRINAAITAAMGLVAPMLPGFVRRYPEVRVVLETENRVVDVAREEVDVAIRVGALPDSDLVARKLGTVALWPCASPDYLARRPAPATPDDLAGHVLLGWLDQPSEWTFTDPTGRPHRVPVPAGTIVPEPAVMQVLVTGGLGIGRLPDFLARPSVEQGRLKRLLPAFRTEQVDVHALYARHRSLSAKVRLFVEALRDAMADAGASSP